MPSWLSGAARVVDLGGYFDEYNESADGAEADAKALFCDWRIVGESLANAMKAFRLGQTQESQSK
jgi:hypothetical protein